MLSQIIAITGLNLRSIPQRWGPSLVIVIGLAGVVAVFTALLAMAQGFQATMEVDSTSANQYGDEAGQQRVRGVLAAGEHQVKISGSNQAGLFALSASADEVPANAGGGTIRVGEPRQALMLQGITSDSYQLTVRQPGSYVIDMTSPIFDTYLVLRKDGQTVAEDDDSGGDMNARLEVQLEAGEYEVKAMSLGSYDQDMEYELSVKRR